MKTDIEQCRAALNRFCQGKERMSVPARPDDDDMILASALDELDKSRRMIHNLRRRLTGCEERHRKANKA